MPSKNNSIEHDLSSGRPLMKDIVSRGPKVQPQRRVAKVRPQEEEIPIAKKNIQKEPPKNQFLESRKPERRFDFKKPGRVLIACVAILAVFVIFFAAKSYARVQVSVTPRQNFSDVDISLTATSDSAIGLPLEIVSSDDTIELNGQTEVENAVAAKAQGQIVIFNSYSASSQTLVATTRFEAPGGKIYRIDKSATIPGYKTDHGKIIPGQLEVTVYADKLGPEYNIGLSDFTIPGFKGGPKYEKIFARSKTEMSAGSSGGGKIVTNALVNDLLKSAVANFRKSVIAKIKRDLPPGIFIPEQAVDVNMSIVSINPPINSIADKFKVVVKASARAMVLKESDISKTVAAKYLSLSASEEVKISNLEDLNFQVANQNFDQKSLNFKISGKANFVWTFDEVSVKKDLSSSSGKAREEVFKKYPGIEKAEIIFKPSWFRFFPSDPSKIEIKTII